MVDLERPRPAPRERAPGERTFAQVFPWRSIRRALMLVVLIVAIVVIKRRMGAFLDHAGQLWGPVTPPASSAELPRMRAPGTTTVHLGPTLSPKAPAADPR
jgi:hypothetical protein